MQIDLSDKEYEFLIRSCVQNYAQDERDFEDKDILTSGTGDIIIGKLIGAATNRRETIENIYHKARQNRYIKTQINEKLFMGAGNYSTIAMNKLHKRLNYAIIQLGGEQQNGGMGTEFDDEYSNKAKNDIKNVIKDIMFALNVTIEDLK